MSHGPEFNLAEAPCVRELVALGYRYLPPSDTRDRVKVEASALLPGNNETARDGMNQVLLREQVISALRRLNGIGEDAARMAYTQLLGETDNDVWTARLRSDWSRKVEGNAKHKTLHLIDFENPANNDFTVTNQLTVLSEKSGRADLVVYANGVPLAVIEAKSPVSPKDKSGEAFDQIKRYERDIPRLMASNLMNVVTDGVHTLYGATGAPSPFWGAWRDPWPRAASDFTSPLAKDLWCLLSPERLLDLLAHYVVFERRDQKVEKKLCRYQQYRAVEKIVARVLEGKHPQGLIWHTQGSGKSLTMVYAALKLKSHRTIPAARLGPLTNPSLLVVTDRIQLDRQIAGTFAACGLPNPVQIGSRTELRTKLRGASAGITLLSTIHKFEGSPHPVPDSRNWIVLVDEAHRSQEENLGAFLRFTFPEARLFGFTGTPVKKNDKDTYLNFGVAGEGYLDRYSIDDAVADGATVPIRYTSRKAEWQIDPARLDILFDQWFADQPAEWVEEVKRRGVSIADLAKHPERVALIAYDLWTHFQTHVRPDGWKAQIVAIDRSAVILYKRALDAEIAKSFEKQGFPSAEAARKAAARSACVYSSSHEDPKPSEDPFLQSLRDDLVRYALDEAGEKAVLARFHQPAAEAEAAGEEPLELLIVCNKLLTGFDAPIEGVMYLDSPLRDHNLLQAIARTNRVYRGASGAAKAYGLIVDYIGVTRSLGEALATYREADVKNALRDLAELEAVLAAAHREVMEKIAGLPRGTGRLEAEYQALIARLRAEGEDAWFTFERLAKAFIRAYEALAPDPEVLPYLDDLKWIATFLPYARQHLEFVVKLDLPDWSAKIRDMLAEHLHVSGLRDLLKLKKITDPEYWHDFRIEGKSDEDLREAAIRKATELKAIATERMESNPARYERFSDRVLEIIQRMKANLEDVAALLAELERVSLDLSAEDRAHEGSGLSERGYGILRILEGFRITAPVQDGEVRERPAGSSGVSGEDADPEALAGLSSAARDIDSLYSSDLSAPPGWHAKDQLRKELRQQVRQIAHGARLSDLIAVPIQVDEFAIRHYRKGSNGAKPPETPEV